jgi:adenylate kinase family enzyme
MKNAAAAALESTPRISVQARALHKALSRIGGLQPLAKHLDVPSSVVREWMFDVGSPPNGVFLRVVDLLLDEHRAVSVPNDSGPI